MNIELIKSIPKPILQLSIDLFTPERNKIRQVPSLVDLIYFWPYFFHSRAPFHYEYRQKLKILSVWFFPPWTVHFVYTLWIRLWFHVNRVFFSRTGKQWNAHYIFRICFSGWSLIREWKRLHFSKFCAICLLFCYT